MCDTRLGYPLNGCKTYRSHGRTWQLWKSGLPGQRAIMYWEAEGAQRQDVATIRKRPNRQEWQVIDENGYVQGGYKSPQAAFTAFTRGL